MAQISESLLATNKYNKPMVVKDNDAIAVLLARLLIMRPGENKLHPEMGIDVRGRFLFCDEDDLDDLREEIADQINAYLPEYNTSEVNVDMDNGYLRLTIIVDGTSFTYSATNGNELSENEISLLRD